MPKAVCDKISVDFATVERKTLFVVLDDYFRYPLVEVITTINAAAIISKLD